VSLEKPIHGAGTRWPAGLFFSLSFFLVLVTFYADCAYPGQTRAVRVMRLAFREDEIFSARICHFDAICALRSSELPSPATRDFTMVSRSSSGKPRLLLHYFVLGRFGPLGATPALWLYCALRSSPMPLNTGRRCLLLASTPVRIIALLNSVFSWRVFPPSWAWNFVSQLVLQALFQGVVPN